MSGDQPKSARIGEWDRDGKTSRTRVVAEMLKEMYLVSVSASLMSSKSPNPKSLSTEEQRDSHITKQRRRPSIELHAPRLYAFELRRPAVDDLRHRSLGPELFLDLLGSEHRSLRLGTHAVVVFAGHRARDGAVVWGAEGAADDGAWVCETMSDAIGRADAQGDGKKKYKEGGDVDTQGGGAWYAPDINADSGIREGMSLPMYSVYSGPSRANV